MKKKIKEIVKQVKQESPEMQSAHADLEKNINTAMENYSLTMFKKKLS